MGNPQVDRIVSAARKRAFFRQNGREVYGIGCAFFALFCKKTYARRRMGACFEDICEKGQLLPRKKLSKRVENIFFTKSDKKAETGVFRQIPTTLKHGYGKEREDGFFRFFILLGAGREYG